MALQGWPHTYGRQEAPIEVDVILEEEVKWEKVKELKYIWEYIRKIVEGEYNQNTLYKIIRVNKIFIKEIWGFSLRSGIPLFKY